MLTALVHLQKHWALVLKKRNDSLDALYQAVFEPIGKSLDFRASDFKEKASAVHRWLQNQVFQYGEALWLQRQACKRAERLLENFKDALDSKAPEAALEHYRVLLQVCQGLAIWDKLEQGLESQFGLAFMLKST